MSVRGGGEVGWGGHLINFSVSDLRFYENERSKRFKINEKEGQLDRKSRRKSVK